MDDFPTTVEALRRGYDSIYLPTALGVESTSRATFGEFQRKVRIGRANFNFLPRYLLLLAPWRPLVAYGFASHKLLRWVAPWLSLALLGSALGGTVSGVMGLSGSATAGAHLWPSALLLAAQLLFHGVAWRGHRANLSGERMTWTTPAYYLDAMNLALLLGSLQALKPTRGGGWERIAREGDEL